MEVLTLPPGGGGVWMALIMARAAPSSAALPEERVIDWLTTRPEGPTVKATPTAPVAPCDLAAAG